jgi:hypothetical protein
MSMNMPELDLALLLTGVAVLLALLAWLSAVGARRRLAREQARASDREQELERQLELVRQSISGLTAGTVGMDRRMQRLEDREKALSERQETYEIQQADDQPYGQAIRLVQQGAGVNRLVDELELSESEAELIVRMHGQRNSA